MNRFFGVALVAFALAIAIIPHFTDCQSQGKAISLPNGMTVPMKCHWTAQAEIATAVPLAVVGGVMFATKRKESRTILAITGTTLGALAILIPIKLIGVCSSAMLCHTLMQPSLVVLGSLAIVASLSNLAFVHEVKV